MIDSYNISGANTFDEYLGDSVYDIIPVLNAMSANMDNLVIFVADREGQIKLAGGAPEAIYYAGDDRILDDGEELYFSNDIVSKLRSSEKISRNDTLDGFFPEKHRVFIQPIVSGSGNMVASVMASTTSTDMDGLLKSTTQTIIMSTLWLMLATLIAVYFITERFVSPLRAMSRAAREFAAGRFDVRVPVSGNDEVAELALAFNNMANSLQHSDETRRLFLANVSHDLRTPMTTISGFIDSIIDGAIPQDKIPYYLEVIASEVRRLSRLVSSLLDITKIQAGERKFNKAPFDICEMAREIIISSEQRLSDKKLDVQFDADRDNMYVSADRDAIYQVLYNLCDNAIKFSDEGGKYIVGINENHGKIKVSVYNEGAGIALEDLPYVFDRFYKSDRSRGLDKTGVGLGLYISRTIIEAHNEKISVESEHGKWCKFTFTLAKTNPPKITDEKKNGEN
jgi:signal transduction histidine kinase